MIQLPFLKDKTIAIFGLGKAGKSTVHALQHSGAKLYIWDDNEAGRTGIAGELAPTTTLAEPDTYPWEQIDMLVLSPGVPLTHPEPHPIVKMAKAVGCPIICDVELLYCAQSKARFIGITGTNGKSTTTALIHHILKEAGVHTQVGGNLGFPALTLEALEEEGVYVLEMSSYQLDLIDELHFDVGVFLNITPDHLDRHGNIEGYIAAKLHLFDRQGKHDTAIVGVDDMYSSRVCAALEDEGRVGHVVPVSCRHEVENGVVVLEGSIIDKSEQPQQHLPLGELPRLPGVHNAQNIAAAYKACRAVGVGHDAIVSGIQSFAGLRHRIQLVTEKDGVTFINDSKATNADAASKALAAYDDIYWIIGGVPKAGGIEPLEEYFPKIRHAYLIGQAEEAFAATLEGKVVYTRCGSLSEAFAAAARDAFSAGKGVVMLSPACASFDQWPNFEMRGDAFCKLAEAVAL